MQDVGVGKTSWKIQKAQAVKTNADKHGNIKQESTPCPVTTEQSEEETTKMGEKYL